MDVAIAVALFAAGVVLAIWATESLLKGLVTLAFVVGLSAFVVGAVLSGLEAENIAVGVAASRDGAAEIAFGSVYGGAIFLVCFALGLGAIIAPLQVRLPPLFLLLAFSATALSGLALIGESTSRAAAIVLLVAFALIMAYLVRESRQQRLLESEEVAEAEKERKRPLVAIGLTLFGLVAVAIGGSLVSNGAQRIILHIGIPAALMGMVITPAAIELEEVIRQAVPALAAPNVASRPYAGRASGTRAGQRSCRQLLPVGL
jgi:cation:H+ antiporter